ncbi:uncharacterized protein B0T15DRAFT_10090 [Chaetomium strumarium]|uniref:Uncharacterized protein n=1 Tax=Chaetomium strumarium TaxID=1170767 RepID=A0AAJ0H176_9PEZI|nr:hypothetical protein B0T15DRAFT_10090 [Chaetomium strumarium]
MPFRLPHRPLLFVCRLFEGTLGRHRATAAALRSFRANPLLRELPACPLGEDLVRPDKNPGQGMIRLQAPTLTGPPVTLATPTPTAGASPRRRPFRTGYCYLAIKIPLPAPAHGTDPLDEAYSRFTTARRDAESSEMKGILPRPPNTATRPRQTAHGPTGAGHVQAVRDLLAYNPLVWRRGYMHRRVAPPERLDVYAPSLGTVLTHPMAGARSVCEVVELQTHGVFRWPTHQADGRGSAIFLCPASMIRINTAASRSMAAFDETFLLYSC